MSNDETRDQSGSTPERARQMKSWEVTDEAWEAFDSARDLCSGIQAAYEAGRRASGAAPPAPSAEASCSGAGDCPSSEHEHGCFADLGNCDDPSEHERQTAPSADREKLISEGRARRKQGTWEGAADLIDRLTAALAAPAPVDEAKLAEVIEQARDRSRKDRDWSKESLGQYLARAVREYLEGKQPGNA